MSFFTFLLMFRPQRMRNFDIVAREKCMKSKIKNHPKVNIKLDLRVKYA